MDDIKKDPFEEYIRQSEPSKRELGYAWYTAMGLQAVDGLEISDYLKNIEGIITISLGESEKQRSYRAVFREEGADINLDYHRAPKGAYLCIQNNKKKSHLNLFRAATEKS